MPYRHPRKCPERCEHGKTQDQSPHGSSHCTHASSAETETAKGKMVGRKYLFAVFNSPIFVRRASHKLHVRAAARDRLNKRRPALESHKNDHQIPIPDNLMCEMELVRYPAESWEIAPRLFQQAARTFRRPTTRSYFIRAISGDKHSIWPGVSPICPMASHPEAGTAFVSRKGESTRFI